MSLAGNATASIGGLDPARTVTVVCEKDVRATIEDARSAGEAIVAVGGRSMIEAGNRPHAYDVELRVAMDTVIELNAADMTVTVEAGMKLARLNEVLSAHGQRVALDPPNPAAATLGGIASTNATGGYRYGFGTPRDLVLGITAVDGCGRILQFGGKVVKNVAGYDVARVFIGAYGTLGVITELTLRTHPVCEAECTFEMDFHDAAVADRMREAVYASDLPLAAFDLLASRQGKDERWTLVATAEGTQAEVDHQCERLRAMSGTTRRSASPDLPDGLDFGACGFSARASVAPSRALAFARALMEPLSVSGRRASISGHLGAAVLRFAFEADDPRSAAETFEATRELCESNGGRLTIENRSADLHTTLDAWGTPPSSLFLMKRLKAKFDPDSVLSPGRFVGGI